MKRRHKSKRRRKGEGSILKLKNCKYWYASFYDQNGVQKRVSTQTDIKQRALVELRRLMGNSERGEPSPADQRKLHYGELRQMLIDDYRAEENRSLKIRQDGNCTIDGLSDLDRFFQWSPEWPVGHAVNSMNTEASRKFAVLRKWEGGPRKNKVSNATINRSLALMRRMLHLAREHGKIAVVPKIKMLPEPSPRSGFFEPEEVRELLKELPSHLRPLIAFLYYCAMRVNEATQLDWSQLDLTAGDHGVVRLEAQQAKSGEARTVPLHAEVAMLLRDIEPKTGRIFNDKNLRREWARACTAIGLGKMQRMVAKPSPGRKAGNVWYRYKGALVHDLRRSAVRNMVNAGVPERVAMSISGHKTRAVFDRYHIVSQADAIAAMRAVETNGLGKDKVKFGKNSAAAAIRGVEVDRGLGKDKVKFSQNSHRTSAKLLQ